MSAVSWNVDWPSVMLTVAVPSVVSGPFAAMTLPRYVDADYALFSIF